tara:strand:- start:214 stop:480 length:267 start_codon:yes stop_codon:yes gene_type:complete
MNNKPNFNEQALKDKLETLLDDENEKKKWNEGLFIKSLILSPIIIFIIGLFIVNRPGNLIELLFIFLYPIALVLIGLSILFVMSSKIK